MSQAPDNKGRPAPGVPARGLLVLDPAGLVVAMNPEAERLLGTCVGRHCWDAVGALDEARRPICQPGCTGRLQDSEGQQLERGAVVRGASRQITCTAVGEMVLVQLEAPLPEAGVVRPLSGREREVLTWAGRGLAAPQVAECLGISVATVRSHLGGALQKLGASTQAQAVAIALRSGEIS